MATTGSDASLAVVQGRIEMGEFCDDTLELWAEGEDRLRTKAFEGVSTAAPLDRSLRRTIVQWFEQSLQWVGARPSDAGQAVVAFDMYCQRTVGREGVPLMARLPGACAAICNLVCRLNGCQVPQRRLKDVFAYQGALLGGMLKDHGLLPEEGVVEVSQQEVLEELRWSLGDMIPAEWWLSAFCERLNDAANGKLRQSIDSCRTGAGDFMRKMAAEATVFEVSPRKLAEATFMMMLSWTFFRLDVREATAQYFGLHGEECNAEMLRKCVGLAAMTDMNNLAASMFAVNQLSPSSTKTASMAGGAPEDPIKKAVAPVEDAPKRLLAAESPHLTAAPAIAI